jgi:hypothetical protein
MGWDKNLPRWGKQCIIHAACTLAHYNLRFEKVVGTKSLENWLKKLKIQLDLQVQHE